jgi:hypothetical protein
VTIANDLHSRAATLIAKERIEGISAAEQEWLGQHLRECADCSVSNDATQQALRMLRGLSIPVPRELAARTQFRVRLRAQEMLAREPRWRLIWAMCAGSWVGGAATAPYVWRGLEWVGHRAGLPDVVWKMGFGAWFALPAIIAATILLLDSGERGGARRLDDTV